MDWTLSPNQSILLCCFSSEPEKTLSVTRQDLVQLRVEIRIISAFLRAFSWSTDCRLQAPGGVFVCCWRVQFQRQELGLTDSWFSTLCFPGPGIGTEKPLQQLNQAPAMVVVGFQESINASAFIPKQITDMWLCPRCVLLPIAQRVPVSWGQDRALWPGTWPKVFCASWPGSSYSSWVGHHRFWPQQPNEKT